MSQAHATTVVRGFGQTERRDTWWATPLAVFLGFSTFIVYATWAAFQGEHYTFGPYLSPFYSPEIFGTSPHSWFGPFPAWWPAFIPASPALLILPIPGGFRFTCYYYRGAYYKAFWADPPSCAVGEPRKGYWGEHSFPLILQNAHRYVLFITLAVLGHPGLGRVEGDVVPRSRRRDALRDRRRHARARRQRRAARQLRVRLPLAPPRHRRQVRRAVAQQAAPELLPRRQRLQSQAHALGLVQPGARSASRISTSGSARWAC